MNIGGRTIAYALAFLQVWVPSYFEWQGTIAIADPFVTNANEGQSLGAGLLRYQNNTMQQTTVVDQHATSTTASDFKTPNAAATSGSGGQVNLQEFGMGGDIAAGKQQLKNAYENAEQLNEISRQTRRAMQGKGCPTTSFQFVRSEIILRVTPIRRTLMPQPDGSNVAQDSRDTSYNGTVNVKYPAIGYVRTWEQVIQAPVVGQSGVVLRYEATPFTVPNDGSSFAYNHRVLGSAGSPVITDYGNKANGYAPATMVIMSPGSDVTVTADLYRVNRTFSNQPPQGCAPDPSVCIVSGVNFCNAPGLGVLDVFGTGQTHKEVGMSLLMGSASAITYDETDADLSVIVNKGSQIFKGTDAVFNATDPVFGAIFTGCKETANYSTNTVTIHTPNYRTCAMPRVKLPRSCSGKRGVHFTYLQESTVLTANFYRRTKVPVTNPITGLPATDASGNIIYTDQDSPATFSGPVDISVSTFGGAASWSSTPDANGYFAKYELTPFSLSPNEYFPYDVSVFSNGSATANISSLGSKTDNWKLSGTASVSSASQLRVNAKLYQVINNIVSGCDEYLKYAADGFCKAKMTCTEDRGPCTTLDGVTFCSETGQAAGIAQLLKPWGVADSATSGENSSTNVGHGEIGGGAVEYLPRMCWAAEGAELDCSAALSGSLSCYTDASGTQQCPSANSADLRNNFGEGPEYADDCASSGNALFGNPACQLVSTNTCTDGADGLFSGTCYSKTVVYDCGTDKQVAIPGGVTYTQSCGSPIRCLGTECHNPKAEHNSDFGKAVASSTMIDMAGRDMICAETGSAPTNADDICTPLIFSGKKNECKIPVGNQIGITPNCCKDSEEAAKSAPGAFEYASLIMYAYKMGIDEKMVGAIAKVPGMEGFSQAFFDAKGAAKSAIDGAVSSTKTMLTDATTQLGKTFGISPATNPTSVTPDATKLVSSATSSAMANFYEFCSEHGMEDLAKSFVTKSGIGEAATYEGTELLGQAQAAMDVFQGVMMAYTIAKIIGHIVFKCTTDELQLGVQKKEGLCHYVGNYCAKKVKIIGCIESRESYCCYKSALARIISEQIRTKAPQVAGGYGKASSPVCTGFTPDQLTAFDWSLFDPSEWLALLQGAGLIPDSTTKADTMYDLTSSKAALATGSSNIINAEISTPAATMERYSPLVETYSARRDTLSEESVCYNTKGQMAWYDKAVVPTCEVGQVVEMKSYSASFSNDPCLGGDFFDFAYVCEQSISGSQRPPILLRVSANQWGNKVLDTEYRTTEPSFDTEIFFSNCKARIKGESNCKDGHCSGTYNMWVSWRSGAGYSGYTGPLTLTPDFKVYDLLQPRGECYYPNGTESVPE